jgi:hypothetical protein
MKRYARCRTAVRQRKWCKIRSVTRQTGVRPLRIVFVCLFTLTLHAAEQLAATEIIHRSVQANEKDWNAGPSFSHEERDLETKDNERIDRTWKVFIMDGSPYRRLIAVDGGPLSAARQKQEQLRERRELARRRSETAEEREMRIQKYRKEREQDHILMTQMQVAFNFRLIGEDNLSGHPVYVLSADPKADYQPPNHEAKVLTGMRGKLWIDKTEFHWAKVEAEVVHTVTFAGFLARVDPGTKFVLQKEPVNDHIWQPTKFQDNVAASILFWPKHSVTEQTFSDYRPNGATSSLPRPGGTLQVKLQRQKVE